MAQISRPMANRKSRKGAGADGLDRDLSYEYRRRMGRFLREHRERLGLTQNDVAKQLGILHTAWSAVELGRNALNAEDYAAVSDLFGLKREDFGKFFLRYTNPWIFALLYGERSADLKNDLAAMHSKKGLSKL